MSESRISIMTPTNLAAIFILVASTVWLAWWFYDRSRFVYVTDARVASTMINVSSRIPGWVSDFPLDEGQSVAPGDTLVTIDSRDMKLQLAEVEARLETLTAELEKRGLEVEVATRRIDSDIAAERSSLGAVQAALSEARVELNRTERDFRRATSLLQQKMISDEIFDERKAGYDKAVESLKRGEAEVEMARAELLSAQAELTQLDVLRKELEIAERRRAELRVERERLTSLLSDHVIVSAIPGIVDETFINPGEYVYPGQRILMLHNPLKVWVKANVKETEIRHISVGSRVRVSVDAYPDKEWQGTVTNIGSSATSQFAMLPSPNPSGNFTKITQRLEIRVELDSPQAILKPGMMVELQIPITDS